MTRREVISGRHVLPDGRTIRVKIVYGSRFARAMLPSGFLAITIGNRILAKRVPTSPTFLRHELRHVEQWYRYTWRFPLLYLWHSLRHRYHDNPFERDARAAEDVQ